MTQISADDVLRLAQLSSLQLNESEVQSLQKDLGNIITYIDQLAELSTDGVEPTYQVTDLSNVWRSDDIDDYGITRDALLALAPDTEGHQIKVPKVL